MAGNVNKSGLVHFLLGLLSSRATGQLIGLIAVLSVIWFAGQLVGLDSADKKLIAMGVVAGAFVVFIFVRWMWTKRSGEALAKELAGHNAHSESEVNEISEKMQEALAALKASHLGAGYRGSTALYALPWYMIIGPSAAGKSTLFANSGLHFPYSKSNQFHIQGFGGTRNCDWWFADQAVLIDTAGRYTTEETDNKEWLAFLSLLRKHRSKLPINGVMVAISVADVLTSDSDQVRHHVKLIRERIEELIQQLGIVFPVYVVFTKSDLISGFEPFFNDLDEAEREQVWGTYLLDASENMDADPAELFETRMDELYQRLIAQRLSKVARERDVERKRLILDFPNQFKAASVKLTEFINLLFKDNPYQEVPWFAGVYFTSGTQEGTPVEQASNGILGRFRSVLIKQRQEQITQAFFINRVFNDVIFRLQDLTRGNRKRRLLQRWFKGLTVTGGLAAIAGVTALLITSYSSNMLLINDGEKLVKRVVESRVNKESYAKQLDKTLALFAHYQTLAANEQKLPWCFFFGVYAGDDTQAPVHAILRQQLQALVANVAYDENHKLLINMANDWQHNDASSNNISRQSYYNALKLQLMLSTDLDKRDTEFAAAQLLTLLVGKLSIDLNDETQQPLLKQLDSLLTFYVDDLSLAPVQGVALQPWTVDEALVADARADLFTEPDAALLYGQIRSSFKSEQVAVTIENLLSPRNRNYIVSEHGVPYMFTAASWQQIIDKQINEVATLAYRGDWVLGTQSDDQGEIDTAKTAALAAAIRSYYFTEYADAWFAFLQSIDVKKMRTSNETTLVVERLAAVDGPLTELMGKVFEHIHVLENGEYALTKQLDASLLKVKGNKKALLDTAQTQLQSQVTGVRVQELESRFADLRQFTKPSEQSAPSDYLSQYQGALSALHSELKKVAGASAGDDAALTFLRKLMAGESNDNALQAAWIVVESQVRALDPETKQILDKLLKAPLIAALQAVTLDARRELNEKWTNQVFTLYRDNLRGRYPFNTSGSDAAMEDVAEVLNEESGLLWRFVDEQLSAFVKLRQGEWQEKNWNGYGIGLSAQLLDQLTKARKVTRSLFPRDGQDIGVSFQAMPVAQRGIRETYFAFNEQSYRYRNEPEEWRKFSWPGQGGIDKAVISGKDSSGKQWSQESSGPWALLKLLNNAELKWNKGTEFIASWQLGTAPEDSFMVQVALRSSRNSGIFSKHLLSSFSLPAALFREEEQVAVVGKLAREAAL
ncbi:type VI secretion system membrane subunit TssM [Pseudoalteromonas fenneropenaei]|uniref:Type VI secretion system membrane subunit TssM n=1 Tax=Pseudoalteromonas fenneropenaei TaxID=1737459 RepID=A0ABV7CHU2_9GAMM